MREVVRGFKDIRGGNGGQDRQWAQSAGCSTGKINLHRFLEQEPARRFITAMLCAIDQRPQFTCPLRRIVIIAEQSTAYAEQQTPTKPQSIRLQIRPRERLEQWQPSIFKLREFAT